MHNLSIVELRLAQTLVLIAIAAVIILVSNVSLVRIARKYKFQKERITFTKKIIRFVIFFVGVVSLLFIWGVDKEELVLFLTSFVAVVGIALFAQWSMLSNITASVLLFTSHPAKVGDTIEIHDKEIDLKGMIMDIGMFFTSIRTLEDEIVTIPNTLFFQKMVKVHSS